MSNPNVLVDGIRSVSPSREALAARALPEPPIVTVNFEGGRSGLLDLRNPLSPVWADMLDHLQRNNRPVYVEIDPETNIIVRLLMPEVSRVWSLETADANDIDVHLIPSAAPHYLRRANPDFEAMRQALQSAKEEGTEVLVTTDHHTHEILDVRPLAPSSGSGSPPDPPAPPLPDPAVSPQRAQDLFNLMNGKSCDPCAAAAPCIPFKYPDDGCYARAHEMCRLMLAEGEVPEKVWIYASSDNSLRPSTANSPECEVGWWYHVAPTLLVTTASGEEKRVIDPSLCDGPASLEEWKTKQNDPTATLEYSDASIYFKQPGATSGTTDNSYTLTNSALQEKRLLLNENCANYGPPPYSCPIVKNCFFIVDRSTFSKDEIDAMLQLSSPATIEAAFYVVVDGFTPQEAGISSATLSGVPNVKPNLTIAPGVAQMTADAVHLDVEDPAHLRRRQRLTWTYRITFAGTSDFVNELQAVTLSASFLAVSSSAVIYLIKQPNPYELDGQVAWLSTDLRVFQIKAGDSKFGVAMGTDAPAFISQVITNLNAQNTGGQTFENSISTDQQTSRLELSETVGGTHVYNFAVARVRYRALAVPAQNVRVFFRLFPASSTSLDYSQATTYRRGGQGAVVIPLLGIQAGEVVTIPCFAAPRIDTAVTDMKAQTDAPNVQVLPADASGHEIVRYFGCWLDINQSQPQFPLQPAPLDGPFPPASRKTIQELVRNQHQCLVAEIAFDPAPIPAGASPSVSDKLAQRNLAIIESANPGNTASHRIPHTFEIRPTPRQLGPGEAYDELMLDWGNTPVGSLATVYLPGVDTNEILKLAVKMYRSHTLLRVDDHTLQCRTGGITYLPIPKGDDVNYVGMLTIDLPETVQKGQVFTTVVRQVTSAAQGHMIDAASMARVTRKTAVARRILGTFQMTIPVRTKDAILGPEVRLLSNLRWIQRAIPADNRWFPVFSRYVRQVAARVDALGGDSSRVAASPSDNGWVQARRCTILCLLTTALLAALIVVLGTLSGGSLAAVGVLALVLLIALGSFWIRSCQPSQGRLLQMIIAGAGAGAVVLVLLSLLGVSTPQLVPVLVASIVTAGIATLMAWKQHLLQGAS